MTLWNALMGGGQDDIPPPKLRISYIRDVYRELCYCCCATDARPLSRGTRREREREREVNGVLELTFIHVPLHVEASVDCSLCSTSYTLKHNGRTENTFPAPC